MKKVLVLAGGFGTRLRSAVSNVPKPLAPVEGQPFLKYLLQGCIEQGATDFVFLLYHEAEKIIEAIDTMVASEELNGITIQYVVEPSPLGTGGAILYAIDALDLNESFYAINADTWLRGGLDSVKQSSTPGLVAVKFPHNERYGCLDIADGCVRSFIEKNAVNDSGWINGGVYHLDRGSFLDLTPGMQFSLEEVVLPKLAAAGLLSAIKLDAEFIDIGVPADYFAFCNLIKKRKEVEIQFT